MANLMQAVQYSKFGGGASALKHVELPVPKPSKDEVLVKVEAASVNPVDWKLQTGAMRFFLPTKFPFTPGTDIAGEVVGLGPGVTTFAVGDKVSSWLGLKKGGSLAEYAVAPITSTVKRPEGVSAIDGASLGVAGSTALQALRDLVGWKFDGSQKTQKNLLITAASGGVGTYAVQVLPFSLQAWMVFFFPYVPPSIDEKGHITDILNWQLAKLEGAHVTATCGARNVDLIRSLGADEVLDYNTPEGKQLKSPSGKKYDAVFHCAHYQPFSYFKPQLTPDGKVLDLTPSGNLLLSMAAQRVTFAKQKFITFLTPPNVDVLNLLTKFTQEGKLKAVVDSTYPLSRAEDAWARSIDGHATGKIIVTVVGE